MGVHDKQEPETCRNCGALIAPRNVQCHRCGRYRDAGVIGNAILTVLIPPSMSRYSGTLILGSLLVLWEFIVILVTRGDALPSASSFTLIQFGAMNGPFILFGQWWRTGTSIFLHHDLLHLAMNVYALMVVGRALEELTDRYRVIVVFLIGGMLSMAISHFWYVLGVFGTPYLYTSAGASGAVCALIGATYVHARQHLHTEHIARTMLKWSLYMLVFGLMVGGINNAAHIGGWFMGAGMEFLFSKPQVPRSAPRYLVGFSWLLVIACFVLGLLTIRGLPVYVHDDAYPRQVLFFASQEGTPWNRSIQKRAWSTCRDAIQDGLEHDHTKAASVLHDCQLNVALNGSQQGAWYLLELAYRGIDDPQRARAAHRVARVLQQHGL